MIDRVSKGSESLARGGEVTNRAIVLMIDLTSP